MPEDTSGTAEHAINLAYEKGVQDAFAKLVSDGPNNGTAQDAFRKALKNLVEARTVALRLAEEVEPRKAKAAGSDK
ncbi:MAG TPA: hypothetical protein VN982_04755 [Candidatus Dormibacteraeota bacterium]|nr:hypothetical protein [Candidatus Dormibacteraeota bacterium]